MTKPLRLTKELIGFIAETQPKFIERLSRDRGISLCDLISQVKNGQIFITWGEINV